jgi:phosphotriesterase-related protein
MPTVETVTGPVDTADLGVTLMHEHIVILNSEIALNYPGLWDEERDVAMAHDRLVSLKAAGVDTIVDLTVIGLGRDVGRIKRIVAGTGLNVIVATGLYTFTDLPMYFRVRGPGTRNEMPDPLEACFVQDITEGIAATGVKASIIKCVTDLNGLTPDVERILRNVARAHRRTGAPISTHTNAEKFRGRDQQQVFLDEGVDLGRVIIGHSGDSKDFEYLQGLMDAGSFIGMDRFGLDVYASAEQRIAVVVELVKRGYASQMVLSHDASCFTENHEPSIPGDAMPDWNLEYITTRVLPEMSSRGVSDDDIKQMMVLNPARIFSNNQPY